MSKCLNIYKIDIFQIAEIYVETIIKGSRRTNHFRKVIQIQILCIKNQYALCY